MQRWSVLVQSAFKREEQSIFGTLLKSNIKTERKIFWPKVVRTDKDRKRKKGRRSLSHKDTLNLIPAKNFFCLKLILFFEKAHLHRVCIISRTFLWYEHFVSSENFNQFFRSSLNRCLKQKLLQKNKKKNKFLFWLRRNKCRPLKIVEIESNETGITVSWMSQVSN